MDTSAAFTFALSEFRHYCEGLTLADSTAHRESMIEINLNELEEQWRSLSEAYKARCLTKQIDPEDLDATRKVYHSSRRVYFERKAQMLDRLKGYPMPRNETRPSHAVIEAQTTNVPSCSICSGIHGPRRCPQFLNFSVAERIKLVAQKKLCFNCLASDHSETDCSSKYRCFQCRKPHSTLLHPSDANLPNQQPIVKKSSQLPSNPQLDHHKMIKPSEDLRAASRHPSSDRRASSRHQSTNHLPSSQSSARQPSVDRRPASPSVANGHPLSPPVVSRRPSSVAIDIPPWPPPGGCLRETRFSPFVVKTLRVKATSSFFGSVLDARRIR